MNRSYIYILTNISRTVLYIGVTSDLIGRVTNHKISKGSIFTKRYNLKYLIYFEEFSDVNQAIQREKQLKNWRKEWKWNLISELNPELKDLYEDLKL